LDKGLIHEFSDLTDKRSVRVSITDKGKMEVMKVLPEMSKVSRIVVGNLVPSEITTLSYLMKKLDFYHNDIFMNNKNASLDELLK
jgi:DNA-binding MarR family transcriptional regulator